MYKGQNLEGFLNEIKERYNNGEIRIKSKSVIGNANSTDETYMIVTEKVKQQPVTDLELSRKVEDLADRIHYGRTYPLESLDELIALGEAAKKFKESN